MGAAFPGLNQKRTMSMWRARQIDNRRGGDVYEAAPSECHEVERPGALPAPSADCAATSAIDESQD